MAARLVCAHLAGLFALASWFAVGADSVADDFGFFLLISAAVSLPVVAVLAVLVVLFAGWVEDNLLAFVLGGPVLVCLGGAIIAGVEVVGILAIVTGVASAVFAFLAMLDWPRAHEPIA